MLSQEADHLSDQIMVTRRSTTDQRAEVIDQSPEADQIRQRKELVSHVAKKVTGNETVLTEFKELMVNNK